MTIAITKTKLAVTALAALTLASATLMGAGEAEAKWRRGPAIGFGIVAGTLVGAALAANAYAAPAYEEFDGRRCKFVREYDEDGYLRTFKVCRRY